MIYEELVIEFLKARYVFIQIEIDKWLNKKDIIRFQPKAQFKVLEQTIDLDKLINYPFDSWQILNQQKLKRMFEEFNLHLKFRLRLNVSHKTEYQKMKTRFFELIQTNLTSTIYCDHRIEHFLKRNELN